MRFKSISKNSKRASKRGDWQELSIGKLEELFIIGENSLKVKARRALSNSGLARNILRIC